MLVCAQPGRTHLCVADSRPQGQVRKSFRHPSEGFGIADDGRYLLRAQAESKAALQGCSGATLADWLVACGSKKMRLGPTRDAP